MKIYKPGEKSKVICETCKRLVSTTFQYRDVPFDDGTGSVKDILVSVCDACNHVVAIPAQSTPAIRRAREISDISLDVALPAPEIEILDVAAWRIDAMASTKMRKVLLAYFIRSLSKDPEGAERLKRAALAMRQDRANGVPTKRLSCKISRHTNDHLAHLVRASGLKKTDVVRGIVHEIEDVLVTPEHPHDIEKLRDIAAAIGA